MIKGMDEIIEFIEQQGEEKKELKKEIERLGEIVIRMGEEIKDLNEEIQLNKYAAIREEQRLDLRAQHAEAHNKILTQKLFDSEKA